VESISNQVEPVASPVVLVPSFNGTTEGDISGNKDSIRYWDVQFRPLLKVFPQFPQDEFLVPTMRGVTMTKVDVRHMEPSKNWRLHFA
jgi:hypothetical protein